MMKCQSVSEKLSEYVDEFLPEGQSEELSAHFESCRNCHTPKDAGLRWSNARSGGVRSSPCFAATSAGSFAGVNGAGPTARLLFLSPTSVQP